MKILSRQKFMLRTRRHNRQKQTKEDEQIWIYPWIGNLIYEDSASELEKLEVNREEHSITSGWKVGTAKGSFS